MGNIKPNELRIGNLVEAMGYVGPVTKILDTIVKVGKPVFNLEICEKIGTITYDALKPIPIIAAAWPEKFKLHKMDTCTWEICSGIMLRLPESSFFPWDVYRITGNDLSGVVISGIYYVHQLQNLYFALTGEELQLHD